jgi:tRNA U34 5-methylaminomethyl-2-thiouridine-forming methyltransferase MnmC
MIPRTALNEFCARHCAGQPQLCATVEAAFAWFNDSLSPARAPRAIDTRPKLSERQQELFDFMKQHQASTGSFPTFAEMAEYLHVASQNAVQCLLAAMEKKGYVEKRVGKARGYKIKEVA